MYRDLKNIKKDQTLSPLEKKVLEGVHARDYHHGDLAKKPSKLDYVTLNKAYGSLKQQPQGVSLNLTLYITLHITVPAYVHPMHHADSIIVCTRNYPPL